MSLTSPYKDNPIYCSSSFYVKRVINNDFNKAIIDMSEQVGRKITRSEVLEMLMDGWAMDPFLIS